MSSAEGPTFGTTGGDERRWWDGTIVTIRVSGIDSAGRFAILETLDHADTTVPLHVHHREDETFYVVDGEMKIRVGEEVFNAGPGSLVFGPKDVPHGWSVVSSEPLRLLIVVAPAGFDEFVLATSEPAGDRTVSQAFGSPSDVEEFAAVAAGHGIELLGSPEELFPS